LHREAGDSCWILKGGNGTISAAVIYSNSILFPVSMTSIERPSSCLKPFLKRFFGSTKVYALHGIYSDLVFIEHELRDLGIFINEPINYDLLELSGPPSLGTEPYGLVLREPVSQDMDELFALHAGYQKEEVLTSRSVFNPAACRLTIEQIVRDEQVLVAELNSRLVGKVHTNALSFSRAQIGGVYVVPQYRRHGIGRYMVASFARYIRSAGMIPHLFVKKHNTTARSLYSRIGFRMIGSYRISYC
jgi:ribosomal protein S18 acetylase RimI-like enzyme